MSPISLAYSLRRVTRSREVKDPKRSYTSRASRAYLYIVVFPIRCAGTGQLWTGLPTETCATQTCKRDTHGRKAVDIYVRVSLTLGYA
jgi:hypothetical protein